MVMSAGLFDDSLQDYVFLLSSCTNLHIDCALSFSILQFPGMPRFFHAYLFWMEMVQSKRTIEH